MKPRLFLLVLLAACLPASAEDRRIAILTPNSISAVPFLEIELRDKRDDILPGINIEVELFANHAQALARLLKGDIELLFTGSSVGWENHFSGGPIVMICTGIWGISSVVGREEEYRGLHDLKGKTVALPIPGAPLDLQMRYILAKNGIDPDKDLRIVYAPFPQTAGQILSGQVYAAPLPEPLATTMVLERGLKRYARVQDLWAEVSNGDPVSPQVALFTTQQSLSTIVDILPALVAAWAEASSYVAEFPHRAAEAHAQTLGVKSDIVATAIENTIFLVPDLQQNRANVLDYLVRRYGESGGKLPQDSFFVEF